ncbi:MAG: hypothetical protein AAGH19_05245 [Pseudomonadota bacterium]
METSAKADLPRTAAGVLIGVAALWLANQVMQPVPLSAGGAFAAGALILFAQCFRPLKTGYVALGALAGAVPSLWVHRRWHLEGISPPVEGSLLAHVLGEWLLGLAVALVCLGAAAWTSRRLRTAPA